VNRAGVDYGAPVTTPAADLLAINLSRLLRERGLTEADLAERLGLESRSPAHAASNVRRYLRGARWPRAELLDRLAEALGCRIADFFVEPVDS